MPIQTPPAESTFDDERLLQRCMNNGELAHRVVDAFLMSNALLLNNLENLAATRNWPDLARAAHRLKGASDNVAAPRLRQLAAELETVARLEPHNFMPTLAALRNAWTCFEEQARDYLGRND